jgi:ferric-dicitrate binding protein FerR (iron transport regulator)
MKPDKETLDAALEAAQWFLRHDGPPLSTRDKTDFLAWLRASPVHVREYLAVARAARSIPSAVEKYAERTPDSQGELEALVRELRAKRAEKRPVSPGAQSRPEERTSIARELETQGDAAGEITGSGWAALIDRIRLNAKPGKQRS